MARNCRSSLLCAALFACLPALLGQAAAPKRDGLILQCGSGHLSVRSGPWKYIPDLDLAEGWKSKKKDPNVPARPGLFKLPDDSSETKNLATDHSAELLKLADVLAKATSSSVTRPDQPSAH